MSPGASDSYDSAGAGAGGEQKFDQCKVRCVVTASSAAVVVVVVSHGRRRPRCLPHDTQALYAYKAEDAEELTISEGDILTIEDEDDEGWYYGRNAQGAYGKFPSNYVELLQY